MGGQTVRLWWVADQSRLLELDLQAGVRSLTWSENGRRIAMATKHHSTELWDAEIGVKLATLQEAGDNRGLLLFSPAGNALAAVDRIVTTKFGEVRIWRAKLSDHDIR